MLKIFSKQTSSKKTVKRKTHNLNEDDSMRLTVSAFENILFHLYALKHSQKMFDQFMEVVEEDVKNKTNILRSLRLKNQLNTNQNTYAAVQIFMLKRYSNRIKISTKLLRTPWQICVKSMARITEMMTKLVIL